MFLDDELLEIGRNTKFTKEGVLKSSQKMVQVCFQNLIKRIEGSHDIDVLAANFKRVERTWRIVAEKLESEGKGFIRQDGFKEFVNSKPEFKGVFLKD